MLPYPRFHHARRLCLASLLSLPVLMAEPASLEQRLEKMEGELVQLRSENQALRNELGLDGKTGLVTVRPAGREPVLSIGGLVQVQGDFGDKGDARGNANDRIRLRRIRLGATGRFLEDYDFKVEGEYVGSGVTLTDGYLSFTGFKPALVRAGQFKTPFGYEFLAADPKLYTIERSLGTDRLTLNRQVGVQLFGDFFEKRLSYAGGVFNGNGLNVTTNDNNKFMYIGRVSGEPWRGRLFGQSAKWSLGANAFTSEDSSLSLPADFGFVGNLFTGKRSGAGLDSQLALGGFELWTEYLAVNYKPTSGKPVTELEAESWYVQASYFVFPKALQAVAKYDFYDPFDSRVGDGVGAFTLGANWFIKGDDLKLMADYVLTDMPSPTPQQKQLLLRAQVIF